MPRKPLVRGNLPTHASNIRRLLREREITHVAFSKQVGLSPQSTYAALGGGDIRLSTLTRMSKVLNVPAHQLLDPELFTKPEQNVPAPSGLTPNWNLMSALMGGQFQAAPTMPPQATDFLQQWAKLTPRQLAAIVSMVKSLTDNKIVDACARIPALLDNPLRHH